MNKRIRYISGEYNWMMGNKYYRSFNGEEYQVSFGPYEFGDYTDAKYVGQVMHKGQVVFVLQATSPHKIKIALKSKLEELGCEFEKETREVKDDAQDAVSEASEHWLNQNRGDGE